MRKKAKVEEEPRKNQLPHVKTSRRITLTFPDGASDYYGFRYDVHSFLDADEALAFADQLRDAANQYRAAL